MKHQQQPFLKRSVKFAHGKQRCMGQRQSLGTSQPLCYGVVGIAACRNISVTIT